jgi:hypothetical protein
MAKIDTAKRELFDQLKGIREITGAGIKGSGNSEYIVIFVRELSPKVKQKIPASFKGIKVKTEKGGIAKAM